MEDNYMLQIAILFELYFPTTNHKDCKIEMLFPCIFFLLLKKAH